MDMQNVSNLRIPEGTVRTIHDKDNRLIWGRVAYDTKYAGDTYQQTYSGKNLFNVDGDFNYGNTNHKTTSNGDGTLTSTSNFTSSRSSGQKIEGLVANTTYTLTATIDSYTGTGKPNAGIIQVMNSSGSLSVIKNIYFAVASGIPNTVSGSFTTPADVSAIWISFNSDTTPGSGVAASATFSQIQLELGSATSYEPYTGGIPAPNPDYPQTVQTVTGEQTVTISDGANSEDFIISLGPIELCKIGNYQDYIYRSGDDWYVHKETNSLTVTSSMSGLGKSGTSANNAFYLTSQFGDIDRIGMGQGASSTTVTPSYSKYFTIKSANEVFNSDTVGMAFDIYTGTLTDFRVGFGLSSSVNTLNLFKTWLDNNPLKVYYPLATPADTQITDTVLISQLNAVHEWMTRYGYNSVVTGNLPIIIDRTNL